MFRTLRSPIINTHIHPCWVQHGAAWCQVPFLALPSVGWSEGVHCQSGGQACGSLLGRWLILSSLAQAARVVHGRLGSEPSPPGSTSRLTLHGQDPSGTGYDRANRRFVWESGERHWPQTLLRKIGNVSHTESDKSTVSEAFLCRVGGLFTRSTITGE